MNVYFSVLTSCLSNEINSIVKNTRNVLTNVVFQVIGLVLNTLRLQVVFRVVSRAIDNMRYVQLLEHLLVSCDDITAQVHKSVDHL